MVEYNPEMIERRHLFTTIVDGRCEDCGTPAGRRARSWYPKGAAEAGQRQGEGVRGRGRRPRHPMASAGRRDPTLLLA